MPPLSMLPWRAPLTLGAPPPAPPAPCPTLALCLSLLASRRLDRSVHSRATPYTMVLNRLARAAAEGSAAERQLLLQAVRNRASADVAATVLDDLCRWSLDRMELLPAQPASSC